MTKNSDVSWIPKPVGCSLKRFTTHICPQFGVIGAVCSDPENLCDQYVFCKRARELQKEPDTLPQWAIEAIEKDILNSQENLERSEFLKNKMSNSNWISRINAMNWMLTLRKPEEKE